jgi:hypothetical protein
MPVRRHRVGKVTRSPKSSMEMYCMSVSSPSPGSMHTYGFEDSEGTGVGFSGVARSRRRTAAVG